MRRGVLVCRSRLLLSTFNCLLAQRRGRSPVCGGDLPNQTLTRSGRTQQIHSKPQIWKAQLGHSFDRDWSRVNVSTNQSAPWFRDVDLPQAHFALWHGLPTLPSRRPTGLPFASSYLISTLNLPLSRAAWGWRVENLSRTYSQLRDKVGVSLLSPFYLLLSRAAPDGPFQSTSISPAKSPNGARFDSPGRSPGYRMKQSAEP
jgi:hypothetical protein